MSSCFFIFTQQTLSLLVVSFLNTRFQHDSLLLRFLEAVVDKLEVHLLLQTVLASHILRNMMITFSKHAHTHQPEHCS